MTGIESTANNNVIENLAYAYDALSRPTSRNADTFGYNDRSEVTTASVNSDIYSYGYDDIGNSTYYTPNSLNQYTEFTYDADGNILTDGYNSFTYDAANRLMTVSRNGYIVMTNFYDAKSRRVRKVTPEYATTFFYDDWNLIEERIAYTNGTASTIRYYWGKDISGTLQGAGGVGGLLYLTVDDTVYVPFYDNIGNVTRYLDENGNNAAQYTYDAFGKLIAKSGPLADFFRHRFSTKYFDVESGLYYYGYRFYHPVLMRWLNRDPLEEDGGANLYCFCKNYSLDAIDGKGLFAIYVHTDGMIGHVGLRVTSGVAYDYGRYHGTYSGLGATFPGPNVLKTNQWETVSSSRVYRVFDFKVCKVLDDGIAKAASTRFDNGMAHWPQEEKFNSLSDLKANERYMGTDWSWNADNCMTFTFRTIVAGVKEAQRSGRLPPKAQRQARTLLWIAFDSCWQTRPASVGEMLERYSRSADWISVSK